MSEESLIAFGQLEKELRRQVREARLDHEAFQMPLKVCELTRCRATCCHDGVYLSDEEAVVVAGQVDEKSDLLANYGWHRSSWMETRDGRTKTRTIEAGEGGLATDFPAHFPRTRCVFLDEEHRCVLQRLAVDEGRHPWWWKPVSCWLHPLLLRHAADGRPLLTLARPEGDPAAREGYPGFGSHTPCGMERADGIPAWQALRGELELLGRIGGRDLVTELS
jgi:hypothetical protein